MKYAMEHCGVLIMAAGQSKRLGTPKQLLLFEGKTFLNRLIDTVRNTGDYPITLTLGAHAALISSQLEDPSLYVATNEMWEEGMASSIRKGLQTALLHHPSMDGILLLVCDQPFISSQTIQRLFQLQRESNMPMAACSYANLLGTPAIFHKQMFPFLLALEGDTGARKILKEKESEVAKLHFEEGIIDIDTLEDYHRLLNQTH